MFINYGAKAQSSLYSEAQAEAAGERSREGTEPVSADSARGLQKMPTLQAS